MIQKTLILAVLGISTLCVNAHGKENPRREEVQTIREEVQKIEKEVRTVKKDAQQTVEEVKNDGWDPGYRVDPENVLDALKWTKNNSADLPLSEDLTWRPNPKVTADAKKIRSFRKMKKDCAKMASTCTNNNGKWDPRNSKCTFNQNLALNTNAWHEFNNIESACTTYGGYFNNQSQGGSTYTGSCTMSCY